VRIRMLLVLAALGGATAQAWACPYSIRDSGFIIRDPVPYRVVWLARGAAPDALAATRLLHDKVAAQVLDQANVQPELLDTKGEPEHPLRAKLEALATGEGQAFLAAPDDRVTEAPPSSSSIREQALKDTLRQTVNSPKRQEIVREIIAHWCVVVVVEGADAAQNAAVVRAATDAAGQLVGFKPEMGDPIRAAPPVVRVRAGDPGERITRWSVGLEEGDLREARACVLFGRGRRVGPVLTAAQATTGRFLELFRLLGKNCTCTADPTWLLGPALPLNWGNETRQRVREALGFDPDNPNVAATLSGVWKTFRARDSALVPGETVPEATTGYMEFNLEQQATPPAPQGDPDAPRDGDQGAGLERRSWRAAAIAGGAIAAGALGGSALVVWLNRRRS
jgi:hypothetical protein